MKFILYRDVSRFKPGSAVVIANIPLAGNQKVGEKGRHCVCVAIKAGKGDRVLIFFGSCVRQRVANINWPVLFSFFSTFGVAEAMVYGGYIIGARAP
jgi:hypothetical protein